MSINNKISALLIAFIGGFSAANAATPAFAPDTSGYCYSALTDTSVNPYAYGIAGNWRVSRTYTYYGNRLETNPESGTDIRNNGTFSNFIPFWALSGNSWSVKQDTSVWVWNAAATMFNKKGFELENKDPLDRYNAGIYGYDNALPVAVVQNSRYRESVFEGFEDYDFGASGCDAMCQSPRSFDFSGYKGSMDSTVQHSGKYSLRVAAGKKAQISASLVTKDNPFSGLAVNTALDDCKKLVMVLKSIRANQDVLLPAFSPIAGTRMLISAWVKEAQECKNVSYTANDIILVAGATTITAKPSGNIIDGWQRYEQVIDLPAGATDLSLVLRATGATDVYFDDLRIHPYNANMKSFVYDPVSLRLMAEMDENNYATFYEYDDDGTLIRLKKETERGIKTIRETRSALLKD